MACVFITESLLHIHTYIWKHLQPLTLRKERMFMPTAVSMCRVFFGNNGRNSAKQKSFNSHLIATRKNLLWFD